MKTLSQRFNRLRILLWREFVELRRDRFTLAVMLLIPVLQITLLAYALTTDFDHLPLCVLYRAHKPENRQLLSAITATRYFNLTSLRDLHEVQSAFRSQHCC